MYESMQPDCPHAKATGLSATRQGPGEPADIGLILRAHAELSCLRVEVIPVLRQIETRDALPDEQLGAALAYLEVTWLEACRRAAETDNARVALHEGLEGATALRRDENLCGKACVYHDGVKNLRDAVAARIAPLLMCSQASGAGAPGVDGPQAQGASVDAAASTEPSMRCDSRLATS